MPVQGAGVYPMTPYAWRGLEDLAKDVVDELMCHVDPTFQHFPNEASLLPLQNDLAEVIETRIGQWITDKTDELRPSEGNAGP